MVYIWYLFFFFSSRRRHTRCRSDWSSDVCSSDLRDDAGAALEQPPLRRHHRVGLVAVDGELHRAERVDGVGDRQRRIERSEERRGGKGGQGRRAQDRKNKN